MSEWRTIDSAPKDETEILAFQPASNEMFVVFWNKEMRRWQYAVAPGNCPIVLGPGVSHWQPLPAPPIDNRP